MKSNIRDILDLLWYFIGRWIVFAIGVILIAAVVITIYVYLWFIFVPLTILSLGFWLISLATR